MAFFSKFFGGGIQTASGVAVGAAVSRSLNPLTQKLTNETWQLYPDVPPDPYFLAAGVASEQVDRNAAKSWAAENGIGGDQWAALVAIADNGPGVGYAYQLRRRGKISDAEFRTALKRSAIEDQWVEPLAALLRQLLSPAELANAVVQGFRSLEDATADAELQGYTAADFHTMVDVTGLPPGPETLQEWTRRGIIGEAELAQGIREGHTKVKYIDEYVESLKRVLSAAEYAGLWIRGWLTESEAKAGGALTGYDAAAMDLLYKNRGRPATPRQIRVAYERGAKIGGFAGGIDEAIRRVVHQSDIRSEYADVEIAASYSLPSPFVLRGLTQSGAFTEAQAEKILLQSGWLPEYAKAAATFFAKGTTAKGAHQTQAELADEYVTGFLSESQYREHLTALGLTGDALDLEVIHADVAAIKSARAAAVTKIRNLYEKGDITEDHFRNALGKLGMHPVPIAREVAYANVVKDPSA